MVGSSTTAELRGSVGFNVALSSPDAKTWTATAINVSLTDVIFGAGKLVASAYGSNAYGSHENGSVVA